MCYEMRLSVPLVRRFCREWNLGDVFLTPGVAQLMSAVADEFFIERLLARHWSGDYGLINGDPVDLERAVRAREEGRSFTGLHAEHGNFIKVVTHPMLGRTVVCLTSED